MESAVSVEHVSQILKPKIQVKRTERFGDGPIRSGLSSILTAQEEIELGSTGAVGDTDSTGELDEVGSGEVVALNERALLVDDLVDTKVGVEVRLDVLEEGD